MARCSVYGSIRPRLGRLPDGGYPSQGPDLSGCLIPDVSFVEVDSVVLEEAAVFVLEGFGPVMLLLSVDVGDGGVEILRADGECAVASLP